MTAHDNDRELPAGGSRLVLVRDVALLQLKLIVDGLRDFVLVPVSLVAGLSSLLRSPGRADNEFYRLLRIGRRSERWINLFGAADRVPSDPAEPDHFPADDIDTMLSRVETYLADDYRRGGLTRQAKERLRRILDSVGRR